MKQLIKQSKKQFLSLLFVSLFYSCMHAAIPDAPPLEKTLTKKDLVKDLAQPLPEMKKVQQSIPNEEKYQRFLDTIIIADENQASNAFAEYCCILALLQEAAQIVVSRQVWRRVLIKKIQDNDPLCAHIDFDRLLIHQGVKGPEWFIITPKSYNTRLEDNNDNEKNTERLIGVKVESKDILIPWPIPQDSAAIFPEVTDQMGADEIDHLLELFTVNTPGALRNFVFLGHGYYPSNLEGILTKQGVLAQGSGGAEIAGIKLPLFRRILDHLSKMPVNTVYWTTCYGGDYNLTLPFVPWLIEAKPVEATGKEATAKSETDEKKSVKSIYKVAQTPSATTTKILLTRGQASRKFTMIAGALTSKVVFGVSDEITLCNKARAISIDVAPILPIGKIDYARYFYAQRFYGRTRKGESFTPIKYSPTQLKNILNYIAIRYESREGKDAYSMLDPHGISSLPSVKLPGWDQFYPFALDDTISVITARTIAEAMVKSKLEQLIATKTGAGVPSKPQSITLTGKKAILLCTPDIPIEINIDMNNKLAPSIVSMLPGTALHKIDSLIIKNALNEVPPFSHLELFTIFPVFPKFLYIKQLHQKDDFSLKSDFVLKNVLINVQRDEANKINMMRYAYVDTKSLDEDSGIIKYVTSDNSGYPLVEDSSIEYKKPAEGQDLQELFIDSIQQYAEDPKIKSLLNLDALKTLVPFTTNSEMQYKKAMDDAMNQAQKSEMEYKKTMDDAMNQAQKIVGSNRTEEAQISAEEAYAKLPNGIEKLCVARLFKKLHQACIDEEDRSFLDNLETIFTQINASSASLDFWAMYIKDIDKISQLLAMRNSMLPIKELSLKSNKINEIKGLDALTEITNLDLSSNKINEIKGLDTLRKLTELNLSGNPVCRKPDFEAQIKSLKDRGVTVTY